MKKLLHILIFICFSSLGVCQSFYNDSTKNKIQKSSQRVKMGSLVNQFTFEINFTRGFALGKNKPEDVILIDNSLQSGLSDLHKLQKQTVSFFTGNLFFEYIKLLKVYRETLNRNFLAASLEGTEEIVTSSSKRVKLAKVIIHTLDTNTREIRNYKVFYTSPALAALGEGKPQSNYFNELSSPTSEYLPIGVRIVFWAIPWKQISEGPYFNKDQSTTKFIEKSIENINIIAPDF